MADTWVWRSVVQCRVTMVMQAVPKTSALAMLRRPKADLRLDPSTLNYVPAS